MKNLLAVLFSILLVSTVNAEGSKKGNPLDAVTLEDGCVLVFADGIDEEQCTAVDSSPQSGQQFICDVLMVCSRD